MCSRYIYIHSVLRHDAALLFFVVYVCELERKNCMPLLIFVFQTFGLCTPTKAIYDRRVCMPISHCIFSLCFCSSSAWRVRQSRVYVCPDIYTRALNSIKMSKLICHSGRALKSVFTCELRLAFNLCAIKHTMK